MTRTNVPAGTPWEDVVAYSRAVRVGPHVHVSGTVATDAEGRVVGLKDPYKQSVTILKKIEAALKAARACLKDVVRTRVYVVNIDHWREVGQAHGEFFKNTRPATTLIEVRRLIDPELLVEIEAYAYVAEEDKTLMA